MVGWHIQTVCFRLLLHPTNEFLQSLCKVNGLALHTECDDARVSCPECQSQISEALGISISIFKMLRCYILRVEKGEEFKYEFE